MENKNPVWNILYIDDDQDDFLLTQAMLFEIEKQKVNLEWAQDYQQALHKLSTDKLLPFAG